MALSKRLKIITIISLTVIISACSSRPTPAPIVDIHSSQILNKKNRDSIKASQYIVQKGETLYSIAWRANSDVRRLAKINKMNSPYKIFPGQKIFLTAKSSKVRQGTSSSKNLNKSSGKTSKNRHKKAVALNKKLGYGESVNAKKLSKNNHSSGDSFSKKIYFYQC